MKPGVLSTQLQGELYGTLRSEQFEDVSPIQFRPIVLPNRSKRNKSYRNIKLSPTTWQAGQQAGRQTTCSLGQGPRATLSNSERKSNYKLSGARFSVFGTRSVLIRHVYGKAKMRGRVPAGVTVLGVLCMCIYSVPPYSLSWPFIHPFSSSPSLASSNALGVAGPSATAMFVVDLLDRLNYGVLPGARSMILNCMYAFRSLSDSLRSPYPCGLGGDKCR